MECWWTDRQIDVLTNNLCVHYIDWCGSPGDGLAWGMKDKHQGDSTLVRRVVFADVQRCKVHHSIMNKCYK